MKKISNEVVFLDLKNLYDNGRDYVRKDFAFHELIQNVEMYKKIGVCYTLYDSFGDAIAMFGAFEFKEKRASVWCLASKEIQINKFAFFRNVSKKLNEYIKQNSIAKVEAYCREDDKEALAFLTRLGFRIEGKQELGAKDFGNYYYMGKVV
jgi:hypothetical protein